MRLGPQFHQPMVPTEPTKAAPVKPPQRYWFRVHVKTPTMRSEWETKDTDARNVMERYAAQFGAEHIVKITRGRKA